MAIYSTKIVKKEEVAKETESFYIQKPEGFEFEAGQAIDLILEDPKYTDEKGNDRALSIASAPHENNLLVATRMRESAFKKSLTESKDGLPVKIDGPFGSFTLHEDNTRPAVMLVGGIGITPFRSIILDAIHKSLDHEIYLFYSNYKPGNGPFLKELIELGEKHENLFVIPTMTDSEDLKDWSGEKGYINYEMLKRYVPEGAKPIFYMAGPQTMVNAMRQMLQENSISKDDIRFEEFSGY